MSPPDDYTTSSSTPCLDLVDSWGTGRSIPRPSCTTSRARPDPPLPRPCEHQVDDEQRARTPCSVYPQSPSGRWPYLRGRHDTHGGTRRCLRITRGHHFFWTVQDFCRDDLLPFSSPMPRTTELHTTVIYNVMGQLAARPADRRWRCPHRGRDGTRLQTTGGCGHPDGAGRFHALRLGRPGHRHGNGSARSCAGSRAQSAMSSGSYVRTSPTPSRTGSRSRVTGDRRRPPQPPRPRQAIRGGGHRASAAFEDKERAGQSAELLSWCSDELNKYAPREGVETDLGGAARRRRKRGRSLGVILVGAQQTASGVGETDRWRRARIRVVGRPDGGEGGRED